MHHDHQWLRLAETARVPLSRTPRQWLAAGVQRLDLLCGGWLQVQQGRVWLTGLGDGADHVWAAGEGGWLPPGAAVVLEPWHRGEAVRLAWRAQGG